MRIFLTAALLASGLAACQRPASDADADADAIANAATIAPVATPPDVARHEWPLPASAHAAQPDLIVAPDGSVLLSWIEPKGDGHALKFARFAEGGWGEAQSIASGDDWFVNWADTPHIAQTADGALWAHWLQKSAAATYSYDVALVRSGDGGLTWSTPVLVNDDGTATEHGFVSLWPMANDTVGVAWLDGRRTAGASAGDGEDPHAGHGAAAGHAPAAAMMTLRTTTFDAGLKRGAEHELDLSTCDCCQTDVVPTATGALLAYRDRTAAEIRDIHVARFDAGNWQPSTPVHADNWTMPACPVNGPSIDARGRGAVVGWYTAAGTPMVRLAHSGDGGARFNPPVTLDSGDAVQGRVDVALGADAAWVLWLREAAGGQTLQLARYRPDLSKELQRIEVAQLQGRGRGTGFPQLALAGDGTGYVIWTDIVDGKPSLHGARIAAE